MIPSLILTCGLYVSVPGEGAKMMLSTRLSPQAKKLALQAGNDLVTGTMEVTAATNLDKLRKSVGDLGGKIRVAERIGTLVTFEISASQLAKLADLDGVVFVASAEKYQNR